MAVKKIAKLCDKIFVIGSKNSSNSVRLVEVAKKSGCKNTYFIDSKDDVEISGNSVGIGKFIQVMTRENFAMGENILVQGMIQNNSVLFLEKIIEFYLDLIVITLVLIILFIIIKM